MMLLVVESMLYVFNMVLCIWTRVQKYIPMDVLALQTVKKSFIGIAAAVLLCVHATNKVIGAGNWLSEFIVW